MAYLDEVGLEHLWNLIVSYVDEKTSTSGGGSSSSLVLTDEINGKKYRVSMRNGVLVSYLAIDGIAITHDPVQTVYYTGDTFDSEGLEVSGIVGTETFPLTNYIIITPNELTPDNSVITIEYTEGEQTYTLDYPITVYESFDPERDLIDFTYRVETDEATGEPRYVLLGWKGTLNGTPSSDRMVVPNHPSIIINSESFEGSED